METCFHMETASATPPMCCERVAENCTGRTMMRDTAGSQYHICTRSVIPTVLKKSRRESLHPGGRKSMASWIKVLVMSVTISNIDRQLCQLSLWALVITLT